MTLRLLQLIPVHEGKAWSLCWSPKGDKFISVGEDKKASVWRQSDEEEVWVKETKFGQSSHQKTLRSAAWSPCGRYVVLASFDAQVTLWQLKDGSKTEFEMISVVEGHESEVKCVTWSPSGKFFASCGRDKNVMIWTMIIEGDSDVDVECAGVMTAHTQDVKKVVWHPHEDILASASYDDTIKLYAFDEDNGDWSTIANLEGHSSTVWSLDFDATGNKIASVSDDKSVKIWEKQKIVVGGKEVDKWLCNCTIGGHHERPIYDISWNKISGLIATAGGDDKIRIFGPGEEKDNWDQLFSIEVDKTDVNCVRWHPNLPNILASSSDDGGVRIWAWEEIRL